MNLTQERINEIALECAASVGMPHQLDGRIAKAMMGFLSRLREEQKPFGYVLNEDIEYLINEPDDRTIPLYQESGGRPLFAIPPAAPDCDCKELVDCMLDIRNYLVGELGYKIDEALAKHKASMGEK